MSNKIILQILMAVWLLTLCLMALADARFCGVVKRDTNPPHRILRNQSEVIAFKREWPCATCTGWQVDHIIPLVCGGCDSVENMQWLPKEIKTCAGTICKDRWEQKVYCNKPTVTIYK